MIQDKINPLVIREMRSRMRNRRTFFGLTGMAILLGGLTSLIYTSVYYSSQYSRTYYNTTIPGIEFGPIIGKSIFITMGLLLLVTIPFSAITFAADGIAGEKERQTYEILRITPMTSQRLVWGKLGGIYILLLLYILLSLPFLSLSYVFGGVLLSEIIIATISILVTALVCTAWGLLISSYTKTTKIATAIASMSIVLFVYIIPLLVWLGGVFFAFLVDPTYFDNPDPLALLALIYIGGFIASLNPLGAAILTAMGGAAGYNYFIFSVPVPAVPNNPINFPTSLWFISPWIIYVTFYLLFTWLLVLLIAKRIDKLSNT